MKLTVSVYEPNGWPVLTLRFRGKVEISRFLKQKVDPSALTHSLKASWTGGAITLVHRAACPRTCPGASGPLQWHELKMPWLLPC